MRILDAPPLCWDQADMWDKEQFMKGSGVLRTQAIPCAGSGRLSELALGMIVILIFFFFAVPLGVSKIRKKRRREKALFQSHQILLCRRTSSLTQDIL